MIRSCILLLISLLSCLRPVSAHSSERGEFTDSVQLESLKRPVIGYYNLEFGRRISLSTYLSPLHYKGTSYAFSGYWTKMLPQNPEHLSMSFELRGDFGSLVNRAYTASEVTLTGNFRWGLQWNKRLPHNMIFGVGGVAGIYGGAEYLPRNGNNPVNARFALGIGATGSFGWHTVIGKLPILLSNRLTLPMLSAFFCPEYGETYYEIYLGNLSGLAHCGWFGNRFGLDNLFSVTLDFGRTSMQVGYRFSMQNMSANNLINRDFNHAFVIGVVPGGIGLKQKRKDIITPLY